MAYKKISQDNLPALHVLQDKNGQYVTHPDDVDALLQSSWDDVYSGNSTDFVSTIFDYLVKYSSYLFRAKNSKLNNITASDIFELLCETQPSAGGMDGWTYSDWSLLPLYVFVPIARILTLVEAGHPWPTQLL
eukprot:10955450-Karenia_brevis.AAC.1